MCGFIGRIIAPDVKPLRRLDAGLSWLIRRGPDSQRLWSSPDSNCELLHAHLAIVDKTATAHQPFWDPINQLTVVFIGEIYNYIDLKTPDLNYQFRTQSDTEVILALYLKHGISGLRKLKGMYAVAIVDILQERIILARDAVGKKPFFIAHWGKEVLFGSSLTALVAVYGKQLEIDNNAAEDFWKRDFIEPFRSALVNARPLLPGEVAIFNFDGKEIGSDSCIPESGPTYRGESLEQVHQKVGLLLREAVARRMHNNPNPTVLLSGGIDSTLVAREMLRVYQGDPEDILALTLGALIPLPLMYDECYARYVARRFNLPLGILRPHRESIRMAVEHCFDLQDEPLGMYSFFSLSRLIKSVAERSRIVLGGDGGDEVFLGYNATSRWINHNNKEVLPQRIRCGPRLPVWMSTWGKDAASNSLVGHQFAKLDRATAEQGVEARCPYLDWDLLSYVRSLPPEYVLLGNRSKGLLKNQLNTWPSWFVNRRKIGFAYSLRWAWGISDFNGLREMIEMESVERFAEHLPAALRKKPSNWKTRDIFSNFVMSWKLAVWSAFLRRLTSATSGKPR